MMINYFENIPDVPSINYLGNGRGRRTCLLPSGLKSNPVAMIVVDNDAKNAVMWHKVFGDDKSLPFKNGDHNSNEPFIFIEDSFKEEDLGDSSVTMSAMFNKEECNYTVYFFLETCDFYKIVTYTGNGNVNNTPLANMEAGAMVKNISHLSPWLLLEVGFNKQINLQNILHNNEPGEKYIAVIF